MHQKLSEYINIKDKDQYDILQQTIIEQYGSGPEPGYDSDEDISKYESLLSGLSKLQHIHEDALLAYNYNSVDIKSPKNANDKKLNQKLSETLNSVTTKQEIVLWRGASTQEYNKLLESSNDILDNFTSLTQSKNIAEQFGKGKLIKYILPKGSHAMPTWHLVGVESPNEREWVLNKNTKLIVTDVKDSTITVKVEPQK